MLVRDAQPGRIGDELLVGLLGTGEADVDVTGGHVGGPEQIFLGLVELQIVAVELVKNACDGFNDRAVLQ